MHQCTYRIISIALFHGFLAFGSKSKHFHDPVDLVPPRWTNLKEPCFWTASGAHRVWILTPKPDVT